MQALYTVMLCLPEGVTQQPRTVSTELNKWKNWDTEAFSSSSQREWARLKDILTNLDMDETSPGKPKAPNP